MKNLTFVCEVKVCRWDELDATDRSLLEVAKEATGRSYAPYSRFSVGAAVRLEGGEVVTGSNQENVAYPSGLCAERTALFGAASLHPGVAMEALAIAACTNDGFTALPPSPCGACRQVIAECESRQSGCPIRLLLYGEREVYVVEGGAGALMPLRFDMVNP